MRDFLKFGNVDGKRKFVRRMVRCTFGKRGQAAVTDLFVAVAIFITLVTITTATWNLYGTRLNSRITYDDMVVKAYQVSDILLKTGGEPNNWETFDFSSGVSGVGYVGLIDNDRHIPYEKIVGLINLYDYDSGISLSNMFSLGQYDFGVNILDAGGSSIYSFGGAVAGARYTVNLARTMIYEDSLGVPQVVTVEIILSK